ncbi:MAG: hypothetical protein JST68_21560 [Bacteroidetes bacterium]|nr:hypothetical protein [Bacteroidota bacterium]
MPWVAVKSTLWDIGATIRVYFDGGPLNITDRVLALGKVWTNMAKLKLREVSLKEQSDIRICFDCLGYSSLVGKQALDPRYKGQTTMCLQGLDETKDSALFTRTVLHEFGHMIGLLHELQSPDAKINWDTTRLYAYYDSVYHWGRDSVDQFVLKQFDGADHSRFDSLSIMLYAVPVSILKPGSLAIPWPQKLSRLDSQFIFTHYWKKK